MKELKKELETHLRAILEKNVGLRRDQKIILLYDENCTLSQLLACGYRTVLGSYTFEEFLGKKVFTKLLGFLGGDNFESIIFNEEKSAQIKEKLLGLVRGDVAILVQSSSFRLSEFRIRLDLNNNGVLVLEHNHLDKIKEDEIETYVHALTYEYDYYKKMCDLATPMLAKAAEVRIISSDGSLMRYTGPFDIVYYNIGDFTKSLGSFYPIGEFFTEPLNLTSVNGTFSVYAYPDSKHVTQVGAPFKVVIKEGHIVEHEGPERFAQILDLIKTENEDGQIWIREMGFGLNRFIGRNAVLSYVGAHERQCGFHVSMGLKHGIYRKKVSSKINQRFHIDMFIDVAQIWKIGRAHV